VTDVVPLLNVQNMCFRHLEFHGRQQHTSWLTLASRGIVAWQITWS